MIDTAARTLVYANAGHPAPFVLRGADGAVDSLAMPDPEPAAGLMEDFPYTDHTVAFGPGDVLLGYTDGLFEAADHDGMIYGLARLGTFLARQRGIDGGVLLDGLVKDVVAFTGSAHFDDDICAPHCGGRGSVRLLECAQVGRRRVRHCDGRAAVGGCGAERGPQCPARHVRRTSVPPPVSRPRRRIDLGRQFRGGQNRAGGIAAVAALRAPICRRGGAGDFFVPRPAVTLRQLLLYGLTMFALQFAFLFTGMKLGMPAGLASLVLQFQVFVTLALAAAVLKERIAPVQVAGALIAGAGFCLVAAHTGGDVSGAGLVCLLLAACSWGFANFSSKRLGRVNALSLVVWGSLVVPVPMGLASLIFEGPDVIVHSLTHMSAATLWSVAYVVYASTLVGYSLWSWLLSRHAASVVTPFALLVPVCGMLSSAWWLGEPLPVLETGGCGARDRRTGAECFRPGPVAPDAPTRACPSAGLIAAQRSPARSQASLNWTWRIVLCAGFPLASGFAKLGRSWTL